MNAKIFSNFMVPASKSKIAGAASTNRGYLPTGNGTPKIQLLSYRSVSDKRSKSAQNNDPDESDVDKFLRAAGMSNQSETNVRIALKFLAAKTTVDKALQTYRAHEEIRRREGLQLIWVCEPALLSEIASLKFSVIPAIANNPVIVIFTARLHKVSSSTTLLALRTFMCHLDASIESNVESSQCGIIFIHDMRGSSFENFDYALGQKMLKILKEACPIHLRAVYVVSPPSWFQAVYKVIFVDSQQMRSVLEGLIPADYLPPDLFDDANIEIGTTTGTTAENGANPLRGITCRTGKLQNMLLAWPRNCVRILLDSRNLFLSRHYTDKKPPGYQISLEKHILRHRWKRSISAASKKSLSTMSFASERADRNESDVPCAPQTFYMSNVQLITVESFVARLKQRKVWKYLDEEYDSVHGLSESSPSRKETSSFWDPMNNSKNRYSNITCLDATRVVLNYSLDGNDYIHANFVDGAGQPRAFINTQGPLESTFGDFWQMVWEQNVYIVVMVTKTNEDRKYKCGQYWPAEANSTMRINETIQVSNVTGAAHTDHYKSMCGVKDFSDFKFSVLQLVNNHQAASQVPTGSRINLPNMWHSAAQPNKRMSPGTASNGSTRLVYHFQFNGWPDHSVPRSSDCLLNMRNAIRNLQRYLVEHDLNWCGHPLGPPIVVHCSAGIGRTGTFCIIDICLSSLEQSIMSKTHTSTNGGPNDASNPSLHRQSHYDLLRNEMQATMLSPPEVLLTLRSQRAHSVQNSRQYKFCYEAIFRYLTTCLSSSTRQWIMNLVSKEFELSGN